MAQCTLHSVCGVLVGMVSGNSAGHLLKGVKPLRMYDNAQWYIAFTTMQAYYCAFTWFHICTGNELDFNTSVNTFVPYSNQEQIFSLISQCLCVLVW